MRDLAAVTGAVLAAVLATPAPGGRALAARGAELGPGDLAPAFDLQDELSVRHELWRLRGKYVFLLFGHQGVREPNQLWAGAIRTCLGGRQDVRIFQVADLSDLPFFIPRSFVRDQARRKGNPAPLLLDWDHKVNEAFGVDPERIDIFVIGPDGLIVSRKKAAGFSDADVASFRASLPARLATCGDPDK